jgi:hypothetical protein
MYSPYKNDYKIFKRFETIMRRGLRKKDKNIGNEPIIYIYMEISQGNSLCSYLKQTKISFFFFYKIREQKSRTGSAWEGWYQQKGEERKEGYGRLNIV